MYKGIVLVLRPDAYAINSVSNRLQAQPDHFVYAGKNTGQYAREVDPVPRVRHRSDSLARRDQNRFVPIESTDKVLVF